MFLLVAVERDKIRIVTTCFDPRYICIINFLFFVFYIANNDVLHQKCLITTYFSKSEVIANMGSNSSIEYTFSRRTRRGFGMVGFDLIRDNVHGEPTYVDHVAAGQRMQFLFSTETMRGFGLVPDEATENGDQQQTERNVATPGYGMVYSILARPRSWRPPCTRSSRNSAQAITTIWGKV